ncbi:MAG: DUF2259 domain-containing protein [Moorea sp. SIO3I7]|nr:DUF2259 domain-containing protein [Moorena sp. SIO3I7]NEO07084.1 DUF2259 domain-containing protein [Moorena sp. SIO3I8]NEP24823.1 DUF2259 domain-containing protein [Moorena sp. SIO3I6]
MGDRMKRFYLYSSLLVASFFLLLLGEEGLALIVKTNRRLSGFSVDSRNYIYLESARNHVTKVPTAKIQIVDVATNACVKKGCLETNYNYSDSNLTPKDAEDSLLRKTQRIRQSLGLNQLKVGLKLPIIERSIQPNGTETVKVLVDKEKDPLEIRLEQIYIPSVLSGGMSNIDRASMQLVINYNYRQLTLGKLNNYREAIRKYSIREVRLSPNRQHIVVLINLHQATYNADFQTTFVQSFPI